MFCQPIFLFHLGILFKIGQKHYENGHAKQELNAQFCKVFKKI